MQFQGTYDEPVIITEILRNKNYFISVIGVEPTEYTITVETHAEDQKVAIKLSSG
jgi:hypothetical protein